MHNDGRRPTALRQRLRRSSLATLVVVLTTVGLALWDVENGRGFGQLDPDEAQVQANVAESDGTRLTLRYRHPETQQDLESTAVVWDLATPEAGDSVAAVVSLDDPFRIELLGDQFGPSANAGLYVTGALIALIVWARPRVAVRRWERLDRSTSTTLALLGSLQTGQSRFGRARTILHLYALDAPAGGAPLCSVPVLTSGGLGHGSVFRVEAKGRPRPKGRIVARSGGTVFWPERRALPEGTAPRPAGDVAPPSRLPEVAGPPGDRRPSVVDAWVGAALLALAATSVLLIGTIAYVTTASNDEAEFRRSADRVVGESVDTCTQGCTRFLLDDDRLVTARVPPDRTVERGVSYPLWVGPGDDPRALLAMAPYSRADPIAWTSALVVGAGCFLFWATGRARRNARVARTGPWHRCDNATILGDQLILNDERGFRLASATLRTERQSSGYGAESLSLVIAGELDPNTPAAVWRTDGTPVPLVGPLHAPPPPPPPPIVTASAAHPGAQSAATHRPASVTLRGSGLLGTSSLVVHSGLVRISLPTYFSKRVLEAPAHLVGFSVDPHPGPAAVGIEVRDGWVAPDFHTGRYGQPLDCVLYFKERVKLPRAAWWWRLTLGHFPPPGARATRSADGAWVDAVHLQVKEAASAGAELAAAGIEQVTDLEAWIGEHREVIADRDELEVLARQRRQRRLALSLMVFVQVIAIGTLLLAVWTGFDSSWLYVGMVAVVASSVGIAIASSRHIAAESQKF